MNETDLAADVLSDKVGGERPHFGSRYDRNRGREPGWDKHLSLNAFRFDGLKGSSRGVFTRIAWRGANDCSYLAGSTRTYKPLGKVDVFALQS